MNMLSWQLSNLGNVCPDRPINKAFQSPPCHPSFFLALFSKKQSSLSSLFLSFKSSLPSLPLHLYITRFKGYSFQFLIPFLISHQSSQLWLVRNNVWMITNTDVVQTHSSSTYILTPYFISFLHPIEQQQTNGVSPTVRYLNLLKWSC
jgi:hypothetical protein